MTTFSAEVVGAILHHMNDDHNDDSLVIVRGHAEPSATAATMTGVDSSGGTWDVEVGDVTKSVTIAWPGPVVERADIRREVVALYDQAVSVLGLTPREGH